MSTRTSATRYAKALLEVASQHADAGQVERQLTTFVETLDAHPELRQALTTPSVPAARKRAIVTAVAERIGIGDGDASFWDCWPTATGCTSRTNCSRCTASACSTSSGS